MWFYNAEKDNFYSRASFNGSVLHKFEIIDIMLPAGYEDILCREYGDWNKFVVGTSDHGELIVDTEIPYTQYIAIKEK